MELASVLAGERFSDHPRSVSRAVAALLRGYNDLLDDECRQDLYRYAADCVGTASGPQAESARMRRLIQWADDQWAAAPRGSLVSRLRRSRVRRRRVIEPETAAAYALRTISQCGCDHRSVLTLVDELIAVGQTPAAEPQAAGRSASSSRLWASSESARRSSLRTASCEIPSRRPVSLSGVGSSPPTP